MIRPIDPELDDMAENIMLAGLGTALTMERAKLHCQLVLSLSQRIMVRRPDATATTIAVEIDHFARTIMATTAEGFLESLVLPTDDKEDEDQGHEA